MGAVLEDIKWQPTIVVSKWSPKTTREVKEFLGHDPVDTDFAELGVEPDDYAWAEGNMLVTTGSNRICQLITGTGAVAFNAAQGYIGVGDGTTTPTTVAMTDLQGTNKYYMTLGGAPSITSSNTINATATFAGGVANFAGGWQEWCLGVATSTNTAGTSAPTGVMLNRKPQNLGTKASGATWTLNASVQIL